MDLREGTYYNPYFEGGLIGMAEPLMDGQVEYVGVVCCITVVVTVVATVVCCVCSKL